MGRSSQSWERAAAAAVKAAVESFADRCLVRRRPTESAAAAPSFTAEVIKLEMSLNEGQIEHYKAVVKVSFLSTVDSALYLASG